MSPKERVVSDESVLEVLEVDLEVATIWELLEAHGVEPDPGLVFGLWLWKESQVKAATR